MTAILRPGFVALALLASLPAAAQSSLGGAGSLPPPQPRGAPAAPWWKYTPQRKALFGQV